jgi:hypothetical protein
MCRVFHKCIFETLATNNFGVRNFVQFVLEVDVRFFLINQPNYVIKPMYLPGGTKGYPSQPGLIRPSIHACRLCIQRKMAQAQQIRLIILQNHEST